MGRLMAVLGDHLVPGTVVSDALLHWPDPIADYPSMRIAGALHALMLTGTDPKLAAVYPPHAADKDELWAEVSRAISQHQDHVMAWLQRPPQTIEVRRSAALIPVLRMLAKFTDRPLALWELGCSAGLNLRADLFRLTAGATSFGPADSPVVLCPEWVGPVPEPSAVHIAERRGVDLSPLDLANPAHQLRLRAYLWADQRDCRQRTEAATALAWAHPAHIEQGDAVHWLRQSLKHRPRATTTVICHAIAWQYLSPHSRAEGDSLITEAGSRATSDSPLARVEMEGDGGERAGLYVTVWPGGKRQELARADFHGRNVLWTGPTNFEKADEFLSSGFCM